MRKKNITEEQQVKASSTTLEERLESIESKLDKTSRWTVIVAIVGVLLGTGGLAGIYSIKSQVSINQAQARQKDAEAASKELEIISLNHAKTVESLRALIEQLSANDQSNSVKEVQKILLDTELDFQQRLMHQRNQPVQFTTIQNVKEEATGIKELQMRCINRLDELREAVKKKSENHEAAK